METQKEEREQDCLQQGFHEPLTPNYMLRWRDTDTEQNLTLEEPITIKREFIHQMGPTSRSPFYTSRRI